MSRNTCNELYENISHITASAPYSIHHTQVSSSCEPALYLHWHDEMEFFLLITGDIIFHIEDQTYQLHSGEGIFIPPKLLHYAVNTGTAPISYYAFVLSPSFVLSSFDIRLYNKYILPIMHNNLIFSVPLYNHIEWQKAILTMLNSIFALIDSKGETNELHFRGLTLLIWEQLYQHHIALQNVGQSLDSLSKQLSGAISYIQDNYMKDLTLNDLAFSVHLSEGQFCRSFKLLTGMTPFRYLNRYRILQSCNYLSNTNKKITEIAILNGFNNISHYNREFMKIMKMTPTVFRRDNN